jgi:hypothetical protein
LSLSGDWAFQLDPTGQLDIESIRPDRTIHVPLPWQAAFPELRRYSGYAWYRRSFEVDGELSGGDLRLRFGAVDYWCEVFLNGVRLGEHEGGYTPFEFGLRDALRDGSNEITVRVFDPVQSAVLIERWPDFERQSQAARRGPPFVAAHVPHGKQDWYVNTGGIWQDVTLTPRPAAWIDRLRVTPNLDPATAKVELRLAGDIDRLAGSTLVVEVKASGISVANTEVALETERRSYSPSLAIADVQPWTLDRPFVYELVASLEVDGRPTRTTGRFGMRSFAARDGRFLLNGEPFYLVGALDQDFYPETVSTVPSPDYLRDQFVKAKQLGFNCVRCHIKPPDPIYLDLADELGLLVWEELPSWRTYWSKGTLDPGQISQPAEERRRVEKTLDAVIERDFNHPSLVIRTLVNEDWGTALPFSAADRRWVAGLYDRCKRLDPTRLVVDNSPSAAPWGPSFHVKSDIDDFHLYATIPEGAAIFAEAVADLALRPAWTYSPHGDAQRRRDEPIVLSEFGTWGLPTMAALRGELDREPGWFDVRPWVAGWEQESGSPEGVEERFRALGLDAMWDGFDAFASATQVHQVAALRYQVEAIRQRSQIAGYVITELTDTYWESNGILDFDRRPKAAIVDIAAFNAQDVLVAAPDHRSYRSGAEASIEVLISRYECRVEDGSRLEWRVDGDERVVSMPVAAGVRGTVVSVGTVMVQLPVVDRLRYVPIRFTLVGPGGGTTLSTVTTVAIVPATNPPPVRGRISVLDEPASRTSTGSGSLADRLGARGYDVDAALASGSGIAVTDVATPQLLDWVRAGGRLLFLATHRNPFFWVHGRGGASEGWITSYSWIRPEGHQRLGGAVNPLGLEFAEVMPERTIPGLPFDDAACHRDVLAGMVVGWVHHPSAHTLQFRFGRGLVVMTTFRLGSTVGLDPIGSAMFDDLIEHLASDRCQPALEAIGGPPPTSAGPVT